MTGIKRIAIAAGLALAGLGAAAGQAQAPAQNAAAQNLSPNPQTEGPAQPGPTPQQAAEVPNTSNIAPTTAGATPPAEPTSPLLRQNGAPGTRPEPGVGVPVDRHFGIQPQVTGNGEFALWMHNAVLFPVITVICLFVLGLLCWVMLRYRQKAHPIPSKTSHNTAIEVAWTLIPVVILVIIALPSIGLLQAQFKPAPAGAVTLKAIGNQWYWTYQYPDHGGFEITANMLKERSEVAPGERVRTDADGPRLLATDNRVVLPVGVPIRLITTANDVIHSWAVPAFWIKLDAVPGRLNETSFTIKRPGVYYGQCSELCGSRHAYMPIAVEAVPPAQFAAWIAAKGGTMPGAGQASNKVIPQPGADSNPVEGPAAGDYKAPPAGPNPTTSAPPATPQGATQNPAGPGNAGVDGQ